MMMWGRILSSAVVDKMQKWVDEDVVENLYKSHQGEAHAESQHSAQVGDKCRNAHLLKSNYESNNTRINTVYYMPI